VAEARGRGGGVRGLFAFSFTLALTLLEFSLNETKGI
jgi:hypothetical protein